MTELSTSNLEQTGLSHPITPARTGIVLGHTHWDREWYLPFEGFRARLVAMLDGLIDMLEQDPAFHSFMLDGQAIMLEDYLQVRPEMEQRVRQLVSVGRLKVGPWYTATDTLLPDPEALVRNLQLGRWATQRLGGQPMAVGYMPDLFGFSAQIPQLLGHFGMENAFAWRDLHPEDAATACWWYSPDGSRVLTLRLQEGYSEAAVGVVDPERFLGKELPELLARQNSGLYQNRLFMMGSDHFIASARLPWVAAQIAEQVGHPVRVGSLDEMFDLVRGEVDNLPRISGEQRDSCLVICPASVAGTRIPLKQANQRVEAALLGEAEPLQALAEFVGAGSDRAHLRWAWRLLTQNHAHDSIPGCSIDEVHREMMTRFARAQMVAKDAAQRGARRLSRALHPNTRGALGSVGVVSLVGGKNRLRVRLHGPEEGLPYFRLSEQDGTAIPFAIIEQGQEYVQYHRLQDAFATHDATAYVQLAAPLSWVDSQRSRPHMLHLPWIEIEFEIEAPRAGYRILRLEKAGNWPKPARVIGKPKEIANAFMRVWADEQGLFVQDKRTGRVLGPVYFSHLGDRGDEYTACPLPDSAVYFTPQAERAKVSRQGLSEELLLPIKTRVPARLNANRDGRVGEVSLSGTMKISLLDDRVELVLVLDNRALNYDLRLVAQLQGAVSARSGAPFSVEQRPFEPDHVPSKAAQQQHLPDFPLRGWVALENADGSGLAVLAQGLYEAAVSRTEDGAGIALTLLRGMDSLSRPDLASRPENAGPMIATPDAQCLGRHEWKLALLPFLPGESDKLPAQAERFLRPAAVFPVQWSAGDAPAECSLFSGDDLLVISTLKPSFESEKAEGGVVILHACNPTSTSLQAQVAGERIRLDETPLLVKDEGKAVIQPSGIAGWKIKNSSAFAWSRLW